MAGGVSAGAALLAGCATDDDEALAPAGETLADLEQMAVGESISVQASTGETVLLTRTGDQDVVAFSAVCTHQGCTVEVGEVEGECPCHGSRFDLTTGEATAMPASEPLTQIDVEVRDRHVLAL